MAATEGLSSSKMPSVSPSPSPSSSSPQGVSGWCEDLSLEEILKSLPKEVYERSTAKGFRTLGLSLVLVCVGLYLLTVLPWFALPVGWLFMGTVYAGLSAVGYDCGTGGFSRYAVINQVVGHIVCLPLCFPFETWRLQLQEMASQGLPTMPALQGPLWWLSSGYQWVRSNFLLGSIFMRGQRRGIVASLVVQYGVLITTTTLVLYHLGLWGLVKYWFIPWLVYHFWMSTFAATSAGEFKIPFMKNTTLRFSICKYPKWVEFLSHDMNYVMTAARNVSIAIKHDIPSYNVRDCIHSMKDAMGKPLEEVYFGWDTLCQLLYVRQIADALCEINWPTAIFLLTTPVMGLYGAITTTLTWQTAILTLITYQMAGLGITVGYHRMWAHRAFNACRPLQYLIAYCGTSAFQGSILWWSKDHRAHHRFVDTDSDPYNINRGFFWAHMGWLLVKQDDTKIGKTDTKDLDNDPLIIFQDRYYMVLAFLSGWIIPTAVAGLLWDDWRGGFVYASLLRCVFVLQATFCINSLAHFVGTHTFDDRRSPRDSWWVSLVTFGEGYHNFHHEFPYDYRNGVYWYAYDPSKWVVYFLSLFGLTTDLKRFPDNEIWKGALQMVEKNAAKLRAKLNWGPDPKALPTYTLDEVEERTQEGSTLMVVEGLVYDLTGFSHPGGERFIKVKLGKDATEAFNGGVYNHSNGARNLMAQMCVGRIKEKGQ